MTRMASGDCLGCQGASALTASVRGPLGEQAEQQSEKRAVTSALTDDQ